MEDLITTQITTFFAYMPRMAFDFVGEGMGLSMMVPVSFSGRNSPGTPYQSGLLQIRYYFSNSRDTTNYSLVISKIAAAFSMNLTSDLVQRANCHL